MEEHQPNPVVQTPHMVYTERVNHSKKKKEKVTYIAIALISAIVASGVSTGLLLGFGAAGPSASGKPSITYYSREAGDPAQLLGSQAEDRQKLSDEDIAQQVGPAVVGIVNKGTFFQQEIDQSSGSGIILNGDGYIATNNHVIENASNLVVILSDGTQYDAKVIGTDPRTDLAVIKIEPNQELTYAVLGDSSQLRTGENAIAIGNPLGMEFAGTVTKGVISALNRTITVENKQLTLIQTDAAINPGNSGGALVNAYGEVIGINTVKISSEATEGLGFAIPINEAKPILDDLILNGYVQGRPLIGISGRAITEQIHQVYGYPLGVYVVEVSPFSGAERAGIQPGDVIVKVEGKDIRSVEEINEIRDTRTVGDVLSMELNRRGETLTVQVELGEDKPILNQ